jgi:hypothetical protein
MSTNAVNIDLSAIQAEIANLSPEEIQKQLVELRTKQRVNQSKHHNSEKQKAYMKKRSEMFKAMATKAKELGIYDGILKQAKANADELIAQGAAADEPTTDVEDEAA